jgi:hypothetical protein
MTDEELREMVRASIARVSIPSRPGPEGGPALAGHPSFVRLPSLPSGDPEGACLIEPAVRCNHCGYCLSYGH